MIFHAQLDWKSYWCYAIEHAMHIRNRLPTTALPFGPEDTRPGSNITPISAFTDRAISLQKLRVFGCAAFPFAFKETKTAPSKFAPNIETNWIFIGIQSNSIYILLNRKTGTEKRTVDCQFKEHVFPGIIRQDESHSPSNPQIQASLPRDRLTSHQTHARLNHSTQESMVQDLESQQRLRSNILNNTCRVTDSDPDLESHRLRSINNREDSNKDIDNDPNLQIVTRSGKVAGLNSIKKSSKGFGHSAALVNALHIEHNQGSTSLGAPAVPFESLTLEQALLEDKLAWEASLLDELRSLEKNNTFEIIEGNYKSTNGRKLISSRWVLRNKFNSDGSIARRNARIVGKGYEQQYGIDYFETFATVIRYATLREILSYAAFHGLELDHLDVDTAFLNPTLKEPNYMKIPEYFHLLAPWIQGIENNFYLKLKKALYGLKQPLREWFLEVKKFFNDMGFKQGNADPNLFISSPMGEKGDRVYILLFVDDMLIAGSRLLVEEVK
ncbi:hypothetical protein K3495_g10344 [Podosphaera aphanis]|nr:hypothetical protein K3495_g10344 [Podosphaera aphanis]